MAEYEIRTGREIKNGALHIAVGVILTHFGLPYLSWWGIVLVLFLIGAAREYWQHRRGKIQPMYIHVLDTVTFGLGGLAWWAVKEKYKIDVDKL